jgi:hypothetical protein
MDFSFALFPVSLSFFSIIPVPLSFIPFHMSNTLGSFREFAMLLTVSIAFFSRVGAQPVIADDEARERPSLARFSSWVLFGGRAAQDAPFLAYGYLSEIEALPHGASQPENESSAMLTFVIEGKVIDIRQNPPALLIESQGTLRFFFAAQAKRDFTKPESFRSGKEIATYDLRRRVLFEPSGGWLLDHSSANLVSSHDFTVNNAAKNLARLWGSQLTLQSRAHAGNGLPSPLPQFSGAIPYSGKLFVAGERTEQTRPDSMASMNGPDHLCSPLAYLRTSQIVYVYP